MPTTPEYTQLSLAQRLTEHARTAWPQLTDLHIRHRGQFAYVEGELPDGERVKLMRLRYSGTASRWGFALYYAGSDRHEDPLLPTGGFAGTPEDALDCACQLHLAAPATSVASRSEPIDWQALAHSIGAGPESSGDRIARRAIAFLLGDEAIRGAVDWYVEGLPASEHARSVLWLLQPDAARSRCLEIYRTDPDPERRHLAVELLRVVATADDLPLVGEFLVDADPAIQIWGIGVLDQLLFRGQVDADDAEPFLQAAEHHPNPQVREKHTYLRDFLASQGCRD
ncbi:MULTISPECIES: HEAT repeat domain-containing protein [unclassified Kitasatospora]|uniref:HEAT repeat domain-containing protein n=1 Tax=unclassified Kitasatospora TaxID=2633591 RepID=UPI00381F36FB